MGKGLRKDSRSCDIDVHVSAIVGDMLPSIIDAKLNESDGNSVGDDCRRGV